MEIEDDIISGADGAHGPTGQEEPADNDCSYAIADPRRGMSFPEGPHQVHTKRREECDSNESDAHPYISRAIRGADDIFGPLENGQGKDRRDRDTGDRIESIPDKDVDGKPDLEDERGQHDLGGKAGKFLTHLQNYIMRCRITLFAYTNEIIPRDIIEYGEEVFL